MISGIESQRMLETTAELRRNTTWKCGKIERRLVNYLQRQLKQSGCTKSSVKEMLQHFKTKEMQHYQFFEAMERLEKRGIIKLVFNPFSSTEDS